MPVEAPFSQHMRLIWIDDRIERTGELNRSDICAAFSISAPQASIDLRVFQSAFPARLVYDHRAKLYRPAPLTYAVYPFEVRFAVRAAARSIWALRHAG